MRLIVDIAMGIAEGLEPWLGHDEACLCVSDESVAGHSLGIYLTAAHQPMCGRCTCGLRASLMAEAVAAATDEEVLAYVKENGEDPELVAAHVRDVLQAAWQSFTGRKRAVEPPREVRGHMNDKINEPPRCPIHGVVMSQQFNETPINAYASFATPNGTYICYRCAELTAAADLKAIIRRGVEPPRDEDR